MQSLDHLLVASVEIEGGVISRQIVRVLELRIPVIAAEDFIRPLAALHDLDVLRDLLGQQIETNRIVTHHRLGHRSYRAGKCLEYSGGVDMDPAVLGRVVTRNEIGIAKFVALYIPDPIKPDR